jgi:hypothetical protein
LVRDYRISITVSVGLARGCYSGSAILPSSWRQATGLKGESDPNTIGVERGVSDMRLSAPKVVTWWVALIIGVVGILANLAVIPMLGGLAFWLVVVAFVLLLIATLFSGL